MWIFGWKGPSGFSARSTAEQVTHGIDATGLTAIITGASSGIGVETARVFALRGVHVVMAVRNVETGKEVREAILKEIPSAKVEVMHLDLSSMASVRKFVSEYISSGLPLNLLINNAGVMAPPFMLSEDNIELQFATNHIGHFLLTDLLLETMKNTARESNQEGRIVNVSSGGHIFAYREGIRFDKINDQSAYSSIPAYGQSKLANILHANELARRLKADEVDITANSLHPGSIATNLVRHHSIIDGMVSLFGKYVLKNVQQGAATTCYVALHPQIKGVTGEYFTDRPSGFSARSTAEQVTEGIDGTRLTAIVTGASSGIGKETARILALRGIGLPPFMLSEHNIEIQFATNHVGHFLLTDLLLDTMKSTTCQSNQEGRIINVSSLGHRFIYRKGILFDKITGILGYARSKLANILHANELARRLKEDGVNITANSVHPGVVATNLVRHRSIFYGSSHYVLCSIACTG
ncbi:NAD(P)-binding Rossmann-fold superfamily protein [Euphorbia peplus]|nr:NAD(P)-binding Rossmann-fold superfamily protein [Euphorbia peplus]